MKKNVFVQLVYAWVIEMTVKQMIIFTKLTKQTVNKWNRLLLESLMLYSARNDKEQQIGGPGIVVEIDKLKFGKRKYHVSTFCFECVPEKSFSDCTVDPCIWLIVNCFC